MSNPILVFTSTCRVLWGRMQSIACDHRGFVRDPSHRTVVAEKEPARRAFIGETEFIIPQHWMQWRSEVLLLLHEHGANRPPDGAADDLGRYPRLRYR